MCAAATSNVPKLVGIVISDIIRHHNLAAAADPSLITVKERSCH